jgi:hypothetical protein
MPVRTPTGIDHNWIAADEAERAERAIDVTPGADAMPMTREGEPDTVARGGTGGLIPPTGANDDGIDGEGRLIQSDCRV